MDKKEFIDHKIRENMIFLNNRTEKSPKIYGQKKKR